MSGNLKQELIDRISATDDENLLLLLKADYEHFSHESGCDVTDDLSEADKEELINLVQEPFGKNSITQQEFDEALIQWRTK